MKVHKPLTGPILRSRVLAYVKERSWRGEIGIVRHFYREYGCVQSAVEDALFDLVTANKLQWFGAEGTKPLPLRYRVTKSGRKAL